MPAESRRLYLSGAAQPDGKTRRAARIFVLHPVPTRAHWLTVSVLLPTFWGVLHLAHPTIATLLPGLLLITLGLAIRFVTNSVLKKNQEVSRDGLYAACRHPMYVGSITLATGIALALNHPLGIGLVIAVVCISIYRLRKEEAFLVARLRGYAEYRREVPMFPTPASIVRALRAGGGRQHLSLHQCRLNGELFRLTLYLPLLLASGVYLAHVGRLPLPGKALVGGAAATLLLAFAAMHGHPADSPRHRQDYLLPITLTAAVLALALLVP